MYQTFSLLFRSLRDSEYLNFYYLLFRCHVNTAPFEDQTPLVHLKNRKDQYNGDPNTKLVKYWNGRKCWIQRSALLLSLMLCSCSCGNPTLQCSFNSLGNLSYNSINQFIMHSISKSKIHNVHINIALPPPMWAIKSILNIVLFRPQ